MKYFFSLITDNLSLLKTIRQRQAKTASLFPAIKYRIAVFLVVLIIAFVCYPFITSFFSNHHKTFRIGIKNGPVVQQVCHIEFDFHPFFKYPGIQLPVQLPSYLFISHLMWSESSQVGAVTALVIACCQSKKLSPIAQA